MYSAGSLGTIFLEFEEKNNRTEKLQISAAVRRREMLERKRMFSQVESKSADRAEVCEQMWKRCRVFRENTEKDQSVRTQMLGILSGQWPKE